VFVSACKITNKQGISQIKPAQSSLTILKRRVDGSRHQSIILLDNKNSAAIIIGQQKSKTPFEALLYRGKRVIALYLDGAQNAP